jgi:hypothetical protein
MSAAAGVRPAAALILFYSTYKITNSPDCNGYKQVPLLPISISGHNPWISTISGRTISKRPVPFYSPTLDSPGSSYRTGVVPSC